MDYMSFTGVVTEIEQYDSGAYGGVSSCMTRYTLESEDGQIVKFTSDASTYFANNEQVFKGDTITAYYDANAPAILIYPPQYQALIIIKRGTDYFTTFSYFNAQLISADGMLKLNMSPETEVVTQNNQPYTGPIQNHYLIVLYGASTRSIPAQTNPIKVIVLC